jgi:hypothetical protein
VLAQRAETTRAPRRLGAQPTETAPSARNLPARLPHRARQQHRRLSDTKRGAQPGRRGRRRAVKPQLLNHETAFEL